MTAVAAALPEQSVFRTLLDAASHPGRAYYLAAAGAGAAKQPAYLAVAQTLLDHEVTFHVLSPDGGSAMADRIFAATKARPASLEIADYVFVNGPGSGGRIRSAKTGTPNHPDRGATVIYVLPASAAAPVKNTAGIQLAGPGIPTARVPDCSGLLPAELACIRDLNAEYPLGVDCFFLGPGGAVMAVPRSTRIRIV